jgi:mannose-6-phosphate isomerase-like protein (cupin superfamily)
MRPAEAGHTHRREESCARVTRERRARPSARSRKAELCGRWEMGTVDRREARAQVPPIDKPAPFARNARAGERLRFGEVEVLIRASGDTTGGAFMLMEEHEPVDTPLHMHAHEDELFYGLEGEHVIQVGDEEHRIGPGDFVFAPRGIPHAQRRVVPRTGSVLIVVSPANLEGFFRELAAADRAGELGPNAYARASQRYGITWLS